jgi:hypothetical protein
MPLRTVLGFFVAAGLLITAAALLACTSIATIVTWEGCETLLDLAVGAGRTLAGLFGG